MKQRGRSMGALVALTVCLLLVRTVIGEQSEAPLSFHQIKENQRLDFDAASGAMIFNIRFFAYPKPRAVVTLQDNSAMNSEAAERAWGHRVDERVEKPVSVSDLKLLEDFLQACRANGVSSNMLTSTTGWNEFSLKELVNGSWIPLRREDYNHKGETDSQFIKAFLGVDSGH